MSQTCPNCSLLNLDSALRCDCGFDFKSGTLKESYLHAYGVENTMNGEQRLLSVGEALRWGWQTAVTNPKVTIFYVLFMYALQWGFTLHLIFKIMPDLKGEVSPLAWVQLGL